VTALLPLADAGRQLASGRRLATCQGRAHPWLGRPPAAGPPADDGSPNTGGGRPASRRRVPGSRWLTAAD